MSNLNVNSIRLIRSDWYSSFTGLGQFNIHGTFEKDVFSGAGSLWGVESRIQQVTVLKCQSKTSESLECAARMEVYNLNNDAFYNGAATILSIHTCVVAARRIPVLEYMATLVNIIRMSDFDPMAIKSNTGIYVRFGYNAIKDTRIALFDHLLSPSNRNVRTVNPSVFTIGLE